MKNFKYIYGALFTIIVFSCTKQRDGISQNESIKKYSYQQSTDVPNSPVGRIAVSAGLIDIEIVKPQNGRSFAEADLGKAKAAVYRFYKNVKLVDDQYEYTLKDEKDINISKRLFETFVIDLNTLNSQIKKQKAAGNKIEIPEISEEYLQNLLK